MIIQTHKELPARREFDFYPTPEITISTAFGLLFRYTTGSDVCSILDPGAGDGPWGTYARALWPNATLVGIESRDVERPDPYNIWMANTDFLTVGTFTGRPHEQDDLVIGNPPYKFAEEFVRRSLLWTVEGGYVLFLMRLAFCESQKRRDGLFKDHPPLAVASLGKRPSFQPDGKTNATAFAIFLWRKGYTGSTTLHFL